MKRSIIVVCLIIATGAQLFAQTHLQRLTGITKVNANAAVGSTTQEGNLILRGMRIDSNETDLNDYVNLTYAMDSTSLALALSEIAVYPDIDVFHDTLFMKDVSSDFTLTRNGQTYNSRTTYTVTAKAYEPFHAMFEAGMSLNFHLRYPNKNYRFIIQKADDGTIIRDEYFLRDSSWWVYGMSIFASGEYLVFFRAEDSSAVTLEMTPFNSNHFQLADLADGDSFAVSFLQNSCDYGKWRVFLRKDETLSVKATASGGEVERWLIFEDSTGKNHGMGASFAYVARETGHHYLVLRMTTSSSSASCSGTISIATPERGRLAALSIRTFAPFTSGGATSSADVDSDWLSGGVPSLLVPDCPSSSAENR